MTIEDSSAKTMQVTFDQVLNSPLSIPIISLKLFGEFNFTYKVT